MKPCSPTIIDSTRYLAVSTKTSNSTYDAHVVLGQCDDTGVIYRIVACYFIGTAPHRWQAQARARSARDKLVERVLNGDVPQ